MFFSTPWLRCMILAAALVPSAALPASAGCPAPGSFVPLPQLIAEAPRLRGCTVTTIASFVATGKGPAVLPFRTRGAVLFRVMPPGRTPRVNALGGSDATFCAVPASQARQLYRMRRGQSISMKGAIDYRRVGGAFGSGRFDTGNYSRLFRAQTLMPYVAPRPTAQAGRVVAATAGGQLVIMTRPKGAAIWLDGKKLGTSLATGRGLLPGHHVVSAQWSGKKRQHKIELVAAGSSRLITLVASATDAGLSTFRRPPKPLPASSGKGQVVFVTNPTGARISFDGKTLGKTPLNTGLTMPGQHVLEIRFSDGAEIAQPVVVTAGISKVLYFQSFKAMAAEAAAAKKKREQTRKAEADKITEAQRKQLDRWRRDGTRGKLVVFSDPGGGVVYVGGVAFGRAPAKITILPGKHTITVRWPDGRSASGTARVKPHRTVALRLKPAH